MSEDQPRSGDEQAPPEPPQPAQPEQQQSRRSPFIPEDYELQPEPDEDDKKGKE
jgi:hypothetical protein